MAEKVKTKQAKHPNCNIISIGGIINRSIEKRIKELEQKHMPKRKHYPVCIVRGDKAETIAKHRKQHEMPEDALLHVVTFVEAK